MKEKLYTIPVTEAFDKESECPFCALHHKLEGDILNFVLGSSYMEEDVRAETDRYGFCKEHYRQMFQAGNHLGIALMLSTHIKKMNRELAEIFEQEQKSGGGKKGLFQREAEHSPYNSYVEEKEQSCYACMRMEARMKNYVDTFFHLWKTESAFRERVVKSKGFCLEHFRDVLREGKRRLKAEEYRQLLTALIPVQKENMKRVEEELDWFIQKFDYRFQNEPWKNAKDAVERGILKVSSADVSEEIKLR